MRRISLLIGSFLLAAAPARAGIIYQSSMLGPTGQTSGGIVSGGSTGQFLGARFTVSSAVDVSEIGGQIANNSGNAGTFFDAIVALSSPTAFPAGSPFTTSDVVASTTFHPGYPSSDYLTPLSATLEPGSYALVFGSGTLGASGGVGFMPTDNTDLAGASYIVWNGFTSTWSNSSVNDLYFEVDGTAVPEPSSIALAAAAAAILFGLLRIGRVWR